MLSRWPVTNVVSVQVSPSSLFPPQWTPVTPAPGARPEVPPLGIYGSNVPDPSAQGGQSVHIAPGWVTAGRGGWLIEVTYNACWPHTSLTASQGDQPRGQLGREGGDRLIQRPGLGRGRGRPGQSQEENDEREAAKRVHDRSFRGGCAAVV